MFIFGTSSNIIIMDISLKEEIYVNIDKEIQALKEMNKEPNFIYLTFSQYEILNIELQTRQRFIDTIPVKGFIECQMYRGIPIIPPYYKKIMKCPVCNGDTWKKDQIIYSCDKHYKAILAINMLTR